VKPYLKNSKNGNKKMSGTLSKNEFFFKFMYLVFKDKHLIQVKKANYSLKKKLSKEYLAERLYQLKDNLFTFNTKKKHTQKLINFSISTDTKILSNSNLININSITLFQLRRLNFLQKIKHVFKNILLKKYTNRIYKKHPNFYNNFLTIRNYHKSKII
jgi:hypothetical protein